MTTTIAIPEIVLDKAKKAKARQAELLATAEALTAEFHGLDRFQDRKQRDELLNQIHEANAECLRMGREHWEAKQQAREDASRSIIRSKEYQALVREAIADWRSELEPWLRLAETFDAAHGRAIKIPQLPTSKAQEVMQLRVFEDEMRRAGVIE